MFIALQKKRFRLFSKCIIEQLVNNCEQPNAVKSQGFYAVVFEWTHIENKSAKS